MGGSRVVQHEKQHLCLGTDLAAEEEGHPDLAAEEEGHPDLAAEEEGHHDLSAPTIDVAAKEEDELSAPILLPDLGAPTIALPDPAAKEDHPDPIAVADLAAKEGGGGPTDFAAITRLPADAAHRAKGKRACEAAEDRAKKKIAVSMFDVSPDSIVFHFLPADRSDKGVLKYIPADATKKEIDDTATSLLAAHLMAAPRRRRADAAHEDKPLDSHASLPTDSDSDEPSLPTDEDEDEPLHHDASLLADSQKKPKPVGSPLAISSPTAAHKNDKPLHLSAAASSVRSLSWPRHMVQFINHRSQSVVGYSVPYDVYDTTGSDLPAITATRLRSSDSDDKVGPDQPSTASTGVPSSDSVDKMGPGQPSTASTGLPSSDSDKMGPD